jgi:hypothetical protein
VEICSFYFYLDFDLYFYLNVYFDQFDFFFYQLNFYLVNQL